MLGQKRKSLRFRKRKTTAFFKNAVVVFLFQHPDQILTAGLDQGFPDQRPVLGHMILEQRPLIGLFLGGSRHVDLLHGEGIQTRIEHTGGDGAGGGVKILHLLGMIVDFFQIQRQLYGVLQGASRMGGHKVGNQELFLVVFLI